jgi:superoxide dismutase, Fe-Mn family
MAIILPKLPYALAALEPHMSRQTLEFHYGKHHKKYVDTANSLIEGTELEGLTLEDMVQRATGKVFNNVAQAWNHAFFWKCLTPHMQRPDGELARALERSFGDFDSFREDFTKVAADIFGSGWAWLVMNDDGTLEIAATKNGDTPITDGRLALLACDVWEHAYYIDYRNDRAKYLQHFWPLVNWEFVAENLSTAAPTAHAAGKPRTRTSRGSNRHH